MRRIGFAITLILASLPLTASAQAPAPPAVPATAKNIPVVGTFDKPSIVLAFYRSPSGRQFLLTADLN